MRLWVDDIRNPPDDSFDFVARTYGEACRFIIDNKDIITHISFDHDLGESKTGYDIAKMIEYGAFLGVMRPVSWSIHAQNPVGAANIRKAMQAAAKYWLQDQVPF